MFFESRVQTVIDINFDDVLKHCENPYPDVIYRFDLNGKKYGFANDQSNANGVVELAILDLDNMTQIESLTIGWCESKAASIEKCCVQPFSKTPLKFTIQGNKINHGAKPVETYFTCGCCGSDFKSTYAKQKKFDQDTGYGICDSCNTNW